MYSKRRNPNLDLVKGALILLVIIGHLLPGTIRDSFPRYMIYGFHMPLFFAVCGYLIKREKLQYSSASDLIKKYVPRVVIPWLIAVQIYFVLENITSPESFTLENYINAYLCPYYHLWFVIAFLVFIILTRLLIKAGSALLLSGRSADPSIIRGKSVSPVRHSQIKRKEAVLIWVFVLSAAFIISVVFRVYNERTYATGVYTQTEYAIMHDFHMFYYFYFAFGMFLREFAPRPTVIVHKFLKACTLIAFLTYAILFFFPNSTLEIITSSAFNILLVSCVVIACNRNSLPRKRMLEKIGKNSLAYYLYIQVAKTITVHFFTFGEAPFLYWCTVIILSFMMFVLISALSGINAFRVIAFGMKPVKTSESTDTKDTSSECQPYQFSPTAAQHQFFRNVRMPLSDGRSVGEGQAF